MQLVTLAHVTHVERVALDEQMRGTVTVAGLGREIDRAVLGVSAVTPMTTEWAAYACQVIQE